MTPEAQQQFIQSLTDRRQEIVKKANLPTTSCLEKEECEE